MTYEYEAGKEYRTYGKHKVTLFTTNARGGWPLVGEVKSRSGGFFIHAWTEDGKSKYAARDCDLMPPAREVWIIEDQCGDLAPEWHSENSFGLLPGECIRKFREVLDDDHR